MRVGWMMVLSTASNVNVMELEFAGIVTDGGAEIAVLLELAIDTTSACVFTVSRLTVARTICPSIIWGVVSASERRGMSAFTTRTWEVALRYPLAWAETATDTFGPGKPSSRTVA